MLILTDTDGDPVLFAERSILRVYTFRVPKGANEEKMRASFTVQPRSIVVDIGGASIAVLESVFTIRDMLRGYGGGEQEV